MDVSLTALRILRQVAERGSFSAAAVASGYTQSAVSRQIASLETALGVTLFERRRDGVRLTEAGQVLLRRVARALDELDAAERELNGERSARALVRLGAFTSAGAWLVPRVAAELRARGDIDLVTRTGSTRSLVTALRAGAVDLAVLARTPPFRPFDAETPELVTSKIADHELLVAVAEAHPLAAADSVALEDLVDQPWVSGRSDAGEPGLGVWPGLPGRARVVHSSSDWMAKLQQVASGAGFTTVPALLVPVLPRGVRALRVRGGSLEQRQVFLARVPAPEGAALATEPALRIVEGALRAAAFQLDLSMG